MSKLQDKVVIITGASSGIGAACVKAFYKQGCRLVLAARSTNSLDALKKELNPEGDKIHWVKTDVSNEQDCKHLIGETKKVFGQIDILINNAGISMRALLSDVELDVVKKLMDVNFWGMAYCTKAALEEITTAKGSIVGVSSIAGYQGLPARTGYSASKFAMHGFLGALRVELLPKDVHVMLACPGFTASNIREKALIADGSQQGKSPREEAKMMTAEEVADEIVNGVLKRKRTLVLTRQGKLTVFLSKFFPKWLDKLVYNHMAKEDNAPIK